MSHSSRTGILLATLAATNTFMAPSLAQDSDYDFASDHFIVKVTEGVAPDLAADGAVSFTYEDPADQPPDAAVAEMFLSELLYIWGATAIEPLIYVELEGSVLERAHANGALRQYTIDVPPGTDILLLTDLLSLCPSHIEEASPAWYAELFQTSDPLVGSQWALHNTGLPVVFPCPAGINFPCGCCEPDYGVPGTADADVDAPEAWELQTGDPDVVVAVIDTGAYMDHPDLAGSLVSGRNFARNECIDACNLPGDPGSCPEEPCDTNVTSHGTFIAGIIAAATNNGQGIAGLAQGCRVMPLRAFGAMFDLTAVKNALSFAANAGDVRVISMSFGVTPGSLDLELDLAFDAGKLMVAAAGNCTGSQLPGGCPPDPPGCSRPVAYPASDPRVMAVTSTDHNDQRSCIAFVGTEEAELAVGAPGEAIVSTVNPEFVVLDCDPATSPDMYCRFAGTSFAAPHVAGLAALIFSVDPSFSDEQVRRIIQATADDLGPPGHDTDFGCGRINALDAVSRAYCPADVDEDCAVGINNLLDVLAAWGACSDPCCPADIDGDATVGILDLLDLLPSWGCTTGGCPPPSSLAQEIAAAGLTQAEWDTLLDCVANGTPAESDNCACWMEHYMACHRDPECVEPGPGFCAGEDPVGHH